MGSRCGTLRFGLSPGSTVYKRDRSTAFANEETIKYIPTENWAEDRLQARGRYDRNLRESMVSVVGVGALGSVVAELLVRGGVRKMTLIDGDSLYPGNVVRHVLTLNEVRQNKAKVLAERFSTISPFAHVFGYDTSLPSTPGWTKELFDETDIIIDCTGSDEVIGLLSETWWPSPKLFVSASLGFKAKTLFLFISDGHQFPLDVFAEQVTPLLKKEEGSWDQYPEVLEGAGCWSSLFPARYDDVVLAAATVAKILESSASEHPTTTELLLYEQDEQDAFRGFRRKTTVGA
jgi:hypothetical protein